MAIPLHRNGPKVVGVQRGRIRDRISVDGRIGASLRNVPAGGVVQIGRHGLAGDDPGHRPAVRDPARAVLVYPMDHLDLWAAEWGRSVTPGAFGENLTVSHIDEQMVHIGDTFRAGSVLLQVSQPREPGRELVTSLGIPDLVDQIRRNGRTGWFCRVLEPGQLARGVGYDRETPDQEQMTVAEAWRIRLDPGADRYDVKRLARHAAVSSGWRESLARR